jgi:hypothetical protein
VRAAPPSRSARTWPGCAPPALPAGAAAPPCAGSTSPGHEEDGKETMAGGESGASEWVATHRACSKLHLARHEDGKETMAGGESGASEWVATHRACSKLHLARHEDGKETMAGGASGASEWVATHRASPSRRLRASSDSSPGSRRARSPERVSPAASVGLRHERAT